MTLTRVFLSKFRWRLEWHDQVRGTPAMELKSKLFADKKTALAFIKKKFPKKPKSAGAWY